MSSRRDLFPREVPSLFARLTRVPIRYNISAHSRWMAFFHIDGMGMMTAQEHKDFRRVQESRDMWKKRAVSRGEERRRVRERRKEVDRSRAAWRDRALAAEQRVAQLEMEQHQLKSAAMQAHQLNAIDNTHFF
jgi:hypothetical protein